MRTIETHKVNGVNEALEIRVLDKPGQGGACHKYHIGVPLLDPNERYPRENVQRMMSHVDIHFQEGPINEFGPNGITQEALLAVVADRLECFQAGPYACEENAIALQHVKAAMESLLSRTRKRLERGVEGTSVI